jgi:uncharacterized protein
VGAPRLIRIVLDSNILFSTLISQHGAPHHIFQAWRTKRFELVTCSIQLEEIRRASRYPKFRDVLKPHRVGRMVSDLQGALLVDALPQEHKAADPHDSWLLPLVDVARALPRDR